MTKFLFVLPTDNIGGAERLTYNLIEFLAKNNDNNIDVIFLCKSFNTKLWGEIFHSNNVTLHYGNFSKESYGLPKFIFKVLCLSGRDYVFSTHSHINAALSLLRRLKLFTCKKLIIRESSLHSRRYEGIKKQVFDIYYFLYGSQDLLVCQTKLMKEVFIDDRGHAKAKSICVLENPINTNFIDKKLTKPLANSKGCFKIVMVGRLHTVKNHRLALLTIAKYLKSKNYELQIIGGGELEQYLRDLAIELKIDNKVSFLGFEANPYQYMRQADLGLLTSEIEGYPNVMLEMMYSGTKNIISTPCCPAINDLPKVSVLKSFNANELGEAILNAIQEKHDNSTLYRQHAKSRSVSSYWNELKSCL